jgi:transglutaminase-like putative cysteine protease
MWLGSLQHRNTAGSLPTKATLRGIPDGMHGAVATLKVMRDLVRASIREPAQRVRETALGITGSDGWIAQIREIQSWVQDHIRYIQDPTDDTGGVELVQTPQKTLDYAAGDCDDQSVLIAALLSSLGHPTRFIAVGFNGAPLSHVLVQTKVGNSGDDRRDWASVETIQPQPLGWFPPGVTSHYILKV